MLGVGRLLYTTENETSMLFLPCSAIYIVRNLAFYCCLSNTETKTVSKNLESYLVLIKIERSIVMSISCHGTMDS